MPRLPALARLLVGLAARVVPRRYRADWCAEWAGELLHLQRHLAHSAPRRSDLPLIRRSLGTFTDAFWIRTHEWSADMLRQDLRFALRTHAKRPGFALLAVITLALGIGANAALFSIVNAVLLKPLPYPDGGELVRLYGQNPDRTGYSNSNPNDLMDVGERSELLTQVAYAFGGSATLTGVDEPMRLRLGTVHSSYFDILRVTPAVGRWFLAEENVAGAHRVVVLSHALWSTTFAADPAVAGRTITLSGEPHVIVGVAPASYHDPLEPFQAYRPWGRDPENRGGHFARAIARLRPGTDLAAAQSEIDSVYAGVAEEFDKGDRGIVAVSLHESIVGPGRPLMVMLFGAVGFLLLIVCANVANLMLARALNRHQEVAVRVALGAGRTRLLRQLVTESLLLAIVAGILGVGLAVGIVGVTAATLAGNFPGVADIAVDLQVLGFCTVITLATGLLFGLAPALHATRGDVTESLRTGGHTGSGDDRKGGLRGGLVIAEVALSIILLVGAGLMLRSLSRLTSIDPGFDPDGVLTFRLSVPATDYPEVSTVPGFYTDLMERIEALPGVEGVGAINRLPFSGSWSCDLFVLEGWPQPQPGFGECAEERVIAGDYFGVMGIPIAEGRWLDDGDDAGAEGVVMVSRTMTTQFLSDGDALARGFKWGLHDERPFRRVVGVVEDIRHVDLTREPMTEVYMPHAQYPFYRTLWVVVRASDPLALAGPIRAELAAIDSDIPIFSLATMRSRVDASVGDTRTGAGLLTAFATLALMVAAIGLYGLLAFTVSRRAHEFGVRMALGAGRGTVVVMVLRQAMRLVIVGVLLGIGGAALLSGALRGVLHEIEPGDPVTFAVVPIVLLVIACFAALLPALRATRVDPVRALREA